MQIRADLNTLEDQLQRTKEFFVETSKKSFEAIKEEQELKDKDLDEKLKKEKPDAQMEDLVKEADAIVAAEIEERRKWREARDAEASTEAKIEETKDEGEPEVSSA